MKKIFFFLFYVIWSISSPAQLLQHQVREHQIKKILVRVSGPGGVSERITWYDQRGYDSLIISPDSVFYVKLRFRNDRLSQKLLIDKNGDTIATYLYLSTGPGAYKVSHLDRKGQLKMNNWYGNGDLLQRSEMADGSSLLFEYDDRGKLLKISFQKTATTFQEKKKNIPVVIEQYFYTNRGALQKKEITRAGQKVTTTYSYNKEGLLVSEFESSNWEGMTFSNRSEHFYNDKGWIIKTIIRQVSASANNIPDTIIDYEYE